MQIRLRQLISRADHFGALSQITFLNNDVKFRTIYGGILSIMIFFLGITYFLYLMILWQTYQILPTVTTQLKNDQELRQFKINSPLFDFGLEVDEKNEEVKQLQKKGTLYDLKMSSTDLDDELMIQGFRNQGCIENDPSYTEINPVCINVNDLYQTTLYSNSNNRSQDTYIDFYINQCDPSTNVNCLSYNEQQYLLRQQTTFWRLTLIIQDVNIKTGKIINIAQDYYFNVRDYRSPGSTFNFDLKVKKATYIIDTGILFPSEKIIEIVKSIQLTINQNNLFDPVTKLPVIADITYSLDRQEEIIQVTYPKLGQILADLGSILQVLLLFGLVMNRFNTHQMKAKMLDVLFQIYFPQIKFFEFKYNWRGKLKSIFFKGQVLDTLEFYQIKKFKKNTENQLSSKLNFINILHEISRLQIQLQLKLPRQQLIKIQQLGYDMDLPFQDSPGYIIADEQYKLLDQEDFLLNTYQNLDKSCDKESITTTLRTIDISKLYKQVKSVRDDLPIVQKVK